MDKNSDSNTYSTCSDVTAVKDIGICPDNELLLRRLFHRKKASIILHVDKMTRYVTDKNPCLVNNFSTDMKKKTPTAPGKPFLYDPYHPKHHWSSNFSDLNHMAIKSLSSSFW